MENKTVMYNFRRAQQLRKWHITCQIKDLDNVHDAQHHILYYIVHNPGTTQREIADYFALSKAAVTKSMKRMLKGELVERTVNENDERKYALYVTEKGQKLLDDCNEKFEAVDDLTLKDFSDSEKEQLNDFILRIIDNLETDYSRGKNIAVLLAQTEKESEEGK